MIEHDIYDRLGQIDGTMKAVLRTLDEFRQDFQKHQGDDANNFGDLSNQIQAQASGVRLELVKKAEKDGLALLAQDVKIDALVADSNKAKGAGWVIMGLLGTFALSIGGAVLAALGGWIKITS